MLFPDSYHLHINTITTPFVGPFRPCQPSLVPRFRFESLPPVCFATYHAFLTYVAGTMIK